MQWLTRSTLNIYKLHMQMAGQGMIDYANGGQGWSGTRNVINRVDPLRAPFEAVSGNTYGRAAVG